ncbi:2TM domain-containing protein [Sediminicola sp. 1XM1-17]|uniref:2TM domain-containing protein n=1 Tax=Sediminicola sp. 1XM1-17 TaxID=3127702 RepID=UPI003077C7BD
MKDSNSFKKAKQRLERLKGFYTHLTVYGIVNSVLLIVYFSSKDRMFQGTSNEEFIMWADWNVLLTPMIWGAFLLAHAACVFKWSLPFLKRWEERQIKKIMEKGNQGF